jgi:hypothetical protein
VIILERPPNFEQVHAAFPKADGLGVLFAYGGNIYNPSGISIPPALIAHENVHLARQSDMDPRDSYPTRVTGADVWWDHYLRDTEFRYNEELLAHAAEFKHQKHSDRNASARLLLSTALRLVAPLYNYQPPRTLQQAMKDLRREIAK